MIHPSLSALVAQLRRQSGAYVLTSVAHGARDVAMHRTLLALRGLRVQEGTKPARSALDDTGLGLIRLEAWGAGAAPGGLTPALLLVGDTQSRGGLLLPAVQIVRASARTELKQRYMLFVSDGTPVRAGHDARRGWIALDTVGPL